MGMTEADTSQMYVLPKLRDADRRDMQTSEKRDLAGRLNKQGRSVHRIRRPAPLILDKAFKGDLFGMINDVARWSMSHVAALAAPRISVTTQRYTLNNSEGEP